MFADKYSKQGKCETEQDVVLMFQDWKRQKRPEHSRPLIGSERYLFHGETFLRGDVLVAAATASADLPPEDESSSAQSASYKDENEESADRADDLVGLVDGLGDLLRVGVLGG